MDWAILSFEQKKNSHTEIRGFQSSLLAADQVLATAKLANDIVKAFTDGFSDDVKNAGKAIKEPSRSHSLLGLAAGGDITAPGSLGRPVFGRKRRERLQMGEHYRLVSDPLARILH